MHIAADLRISLGVAAVEEIHAAVASFVDASLRKGMLTESDQSLQAALMSCRTVHNSTTSAHSASLLCNQQTYAHGSTR
eukprot:m.290207 g.290207  ORF g.290207 m.290207 type:complete len:79 (+) comp19974_c2_seq19:547-783(+)